jgi:predicted DCC family thiol-disulfide oxidoreductase YuxK
MKNNPLELLIDEDCPMCNMYGNYLAKNGLVSLNSYQNSIQEKNTAVNYERAKNQIALIDHDNNKTLYGLDALYRAFGTKFPKLISFFKLPLPATIMPVVYSFISYNRKQIAPSNSKVCAPNFVLKYRVAFLLFGLLFSAFIVRLFCKSFIFYSISSISFVEIVILGLGQLFIQYVILHRYNFTKRIDYLGNLVTINLLGSLLLLPFIFWNTFMDLHFIFYLGYPLFVFTVMLWQHIKRCNILCIRNMTTVSFVGYFVLLFFYALILIGVMH